MSRAITPESFARHVIDKLGHDPEALELVVRLVELMAERNRARRAK